MCQNTHHFVQISYCMFCIFSQRYVSCATGVVHLSRYFVPNEVICCALRVHGQIIFLICFPGVFGASLTLACLARLGARAAARTRATVARPRLMSEIAFSPWKCVFRSRHVLHACVMEWIVLIGWRVSEERCGEQFGFFCFSRLLS